MKPNFCEAKTRENKRCTMKASTVVGGHNYCGNHAHIVKATQLKDAPQKSRAEDKAATLGQRYAMTEAKFVKEATETLANPLHYREAVARDPEADADRCLDILRSLMENDVTDAMLVRTLIDWKAGAL